MRIVSIGLYVGESYFFVGMFLKEEMVIGGVEKENGKSMMKKISVDVRYEVIYWEENK